MNKQAQIIIRLLSVCDNNNDIELDTEDVIDFIEKYKNIYFGHGVGLGKKYVDNALKKALGDIFTENSDGKYISGILWIVWVGSDVNLNDIIDIGEEINTLFDVDDNIFAVGIDDKFINRAEVTIIAGANDD